jgi:hypothetical protein
MNTRDRLTQDWESAQVGDGEWTEMEENWSYGASNVRDAATLQKKVKLEPLVINSEFGELPDLYGYLKFPQGLPAALVKLAYVKYPKLTKGYIERIIAPLDPGRQPVPTGAPGSADGDNPVHEDATSDPSGEGFQVAKAAGAPPERSLLATAEIMRFDDLKARRETSDPASNIALDARFAPAGETGAGAAASAADRREGGDAEAVAGAANATDHPVDQEAESLAVQEQKQYFGELEREHGSGHDDELGAPDW